MTRVAGALLLCLLVAGCGARVQGSFLGRGLPLEPARRQTIVIIYNHGFSTDLAGHYQPRLPPILETARQRNPDVVVFSQVRNSIRLESAQHAGYIASAVEYFEDLGVPRGNIILAGQSCGAWGSLQAAAFEVPDIGGVMAFSPTCHGRLPYSSETHLRRRREIDELAQHAAFPGVVFLYDGDAYNELDDWAGFAALASTLKLERLDREAVTRTCERCARDSHGAVWDARFGSAYFDTHLQPLIEGVRERIRAREGR
jgi:hypothetical protein